MGEVEESWEEPDKDSRQSVIDHEIGKRTTDDHVKDTERTMFAYRSVDDIILFSCRTG